jgi:hypothetical protein
MHKALRIAATETPEKKDDKASAVVSPQQLVAEADTLLIQFRDEITVNDLRDTATPSKKDKDKKTQSKFEDVLAAKVKELESHVAKSRKKNLLTVAAQLSSKSNALSGARCVLVKARALCMKDSEANRRGLKNAVALAQSKHDFTVKEFPFAIKMLSAKVDAKDLSDQDSMEAAFSHFSISTLKRKYFLIEDDVANVMQWRILDELVSGHFKALEGKALDVVHADLMKFVNVTLGKSGEFVAGPTLRDIILHLDVMCNLDSKQDFEIKTTLDHIKHHSTPARLGCKAHFTSSGACGVKSPSCLSLLLRSCPGCPGGNLPGSRCGHTGEIL